MTNHAFNLLLFAHPLTGIRELSEDERKQLIDAAKYIEALEARVREFDSKPGIMP